jgi:hypothetical protein
MRSFMMSRRLSFPISWYSFLIRISARREANQNNAQTTAGDNQILPVRPRHRLISF